MVAAQGPIQNAYVDSAFLTFDLPSDATRFGEFLTDFTAACGAKGIWDILNGTSMRLQAMTQAQMMQNLARYVKYTEFRNRQTE